MTHPPQLRATTPHLLTRPLTLAAFAALLAVAPVQAALAAPGPGAAHAVLSGGAVTCTGAILLGDVGTFAPGSPVTQTGCSIAGAVQLGDSAAVAASSGFLAGYDAVAALPPDRCDLFLSGPLTNVTLPPGTYCFPAAATLTGQLTLDGPADGAWLFRVGSGGSGALTGTGFSVVMAGGGLASGVTWWVADAATMTSSAFQGTILAGTAATFTGGSVNGHVLARGAVTLTGTTVSFVSP